MGRRGLKRLRLLPLLFEGRTSPPPNILVLHIGGNNLGFMKGKSLILQALADFKVICEKWQGFHLVWSAIFPHWVWQRVAWSPIAIERAGRKANWEIGWVLLSGSGSDVAQPRIRSELASEGLFHTGTPWVCTGQALQLQRHRGQWS